MQEYQYLISNAVSYFWNTRSSQIEKQKENGKIDAGSRWAVTWGKQMDWFLELFKKLTMDLWVPEECIHTRRNSLPGYFRPSKDWDLVVVSPHGKLVACLELKSQVGSFWNNFNNRTEEALWNAIDIWTAYRENAFPNQQQPFVWYLMVAEKTEKSSKPVKLTNAHFPILEEFQKTSYLDRYRIFCQKLMRERHYTATALIWTSNANEYGDLSEDISINSFLNLYKAYILSQINDFTDLQK